MQLFWSYLLEQACRHLPRQCHRHDEFAVIGLKNVIEVRELVDTLNLQQSNTLESFDERSLLKPALVVDLGSPPGNHAGALDIASGTHRSIAKRQARTSEVWTPPGALGRD